MAWGAGQIAFGLPNMVEMHPPMMPFKKEIIGSKMSTSIPYASLSTGKGMQMIDTQEERNRSCTKSVPSDICRGFICFHV